MLKRSIWKAGLEEKRYSQHSEKVTTATRLFGKELHGHLCEKAVEQCKRTSNELMFGATQFDVESQPSTSTESP